MPHPATPPRLAEPAATPGALRNRLLAGAAIFVPLALGLAVGEAAAQGNVIAMDQMTTQDLATLFGTDQGFATIADGFLIDVPTGPGVLGTMIPWAVLNLGTVASADGAGIDLTMGGSVNNPAGGTIIGATHGVRISGGAGTVTNAGTIASAGTGVALVAPGTVDNAAGGLIAGGVHGVFAMANQTRATVVNGTTMTVTTSGVGSTVANAGTITGGTGAGVRLDQGGAVTNAASGTISGTYGVDVRGFASYTSTMTNTTTVDGTVFTTVNVNLVDPAAIANAGTIIGTAAGISLDITGSVTNGVGGLIQGSAVGVAIRYGLLTNAGTIRATAGTGIQTFDAGVTNSGLIEGQNGVSASTVQNSGIIVGSIFIGVQVGERLENTGTIIGTQSGVRSVSYGEGSYRSSYTITNPGASVVRDPPVNVSPRLATVVNDGTILAGADIYGVFPSAGVQVYGLGFLDNRAGGVIAGGIGVEARQGAPERVVNEVRDLGNGATIVSSTTFFSRAATVLNAGTIVGLEPIGADGGTVAIRLGEGDDLLILDTGSVLVGMADGGPDFDGPGRDRVLLTGTGSEDNAFVNFETLRMRGADWTLSGTSTFVTSTVEMGRLGIDGTLASPDVMVLAAGTLGGVGTVAGTLANGGTIAPGRSIGTLTIDGAFNNGTGGVLQVEVAPTGAGDRLVVVGAPGTAALAGTVAAVTGDALFTSGQRFTILATSGTVGGAFGTLTSDFESVFLDPTLQYLFNGAAPTTAVNQVDLVFQRNGTAINDVARTFNQRAVSGTLDAIEALGAAAAAPVQTLITLVLNLDTEADVQALLDNLSGESHGSTQTLMQGSGERFMSAVLASGGASAFGLASLAAAPGEAPQVAALGDAASLVAEAGEAEAGRGAGLWLRPFAVSGDIDSDGNAGGLDYSAGGIAGGAAFEIAEGFFFGAALGYEALDADFDRFGDNAEDDAIQAALYGGFEDGPLLVTGALGYAHHSVDADRNVTNEAGTLVPARSDYDADQILAGVAGGYSIDLDGGLRITPQAALVYARLDRDGFTERGDGATLLTVDEETTESLLGRIGARIAMDLETDAWTLTPAASLDVAHEFLDEAAFVTAGFTAVPEAGSFTAKGVEADATSVEFGLGLAAVSGDGLGLFLDYRGNFSGSGEEHSFAAGVRLSW